ncbi:MAG TPA: hypothetical protein DEP99_01495 [Nitrospiraceae bacterium]|nr:hypothetical protein [Nitrospiraceae bacterium]
MDADCLIKLTKAGLKEHICQHYKIVIPRIVKREVVDAGKTKGYPDASLVEKNIQNNCLRVSEEKSLSHLKGDQALLEIFKLGHYDAIATDDAKLIRFLRSTDIPFILPGIFIYFLYQRKIIDHGTALYWLKELSKFVSEDEYSMIKLLLEEKL